MRCVAINRVAGNLCRMPRSLIPVLLALVVLGAACSGSAGETTTTAVPAETTSAPETTLPADTAGVTTPPTTEATPTPSVDPGQPTEATIVADDPNPELVATINGLIAITEETRGLKFLRSPLVAIVTEQELADRVSALLEEELEPDETARDDAVYESLGIIDPQEDLREVFIDLYTEQVAGFYDGDTEELVVPASDGNLTALQKLTMVHELVHSLTDQHFEFNEHSNMLYDEDRFDEASALSGLLEGDATWTELIYFQTGMSVQDQREVLEESLNIDTTTLDSTPSFIADSLIWPYDLAGGTGFVSSLWTETGDFSAVNAAYESLPTTTEQVIDLDAYRDREEAAAVTLLPTPVPGYEVGEESTWGQQAYAALFNQSLSTRTAEDAANGWGGDVYRVLWDGDNAIFVNLFAGDEASDAEEMYAAWSELGQTQIPSDRYFFVGTTGNEVLVIVADSEATGEAVLEPYRAIFAD